MKNCNNPSSSQVHGKTMKRQKVMGDLFKTSSFQTGFAKQAAQAGLNRNQTAELFKLAAARFDL